MIKRAFFACLAAVISQNCWAAAQEVYAVFDNGAYNQIFALNPQSFHLDDSYNVGTLQAPATGLTVTDNGIYYSTAHNFYRYDFDGTLQGTRPIGSDFNYDKIAAYNNSAYAVFDNGAYNQIFVYDQQTLSTTNSYNVGSLSAPATGLAVDANGIYYSTAHDLYRYGFDGTLLRSKPIGTDFNYDQVATYNNLVYAVFDNGAYNQIFVLDPVTLSLVNSYNVGSLSAPATGLAVDSDGIYYSTAHDLYRYGFDGTLLGSKPIGTDFNYDQLAVHAAAPVVQMDTVPEPSLWAMLTGGFAATGAVLRRKRRVEAQPA